MREHWLQIPLGDGTSIWLPPEREGDWYFIGAYLCRKGIKNIYRYQWPA
jgi:hypothetical protein